MVNSLTLYIPQSQPTRQEHMKHTAILSSSLMYDILERGALIQIVTNLRINNHLERNRATFSDRRNEAPKDTRVSS